MVAATYTKEWLRCHIHALVAFLAGAQLLVPGKPPVTRFPPLPG
jgi:hypothetical protein